MQRLSELSHVQKNNIYCYIASAKTKRDWLIRGHVKLDKSNVSLGQQVKIVARL